MSEVGEYRGDVVRSDSVGGGSGQEVMASAFHAGAHHCDHGFDGFRWGPDGRQRVVEFVEGVDGATPPLSALPPVTEAEQPVLVAAVEHRIVDPVRCAAVQ